MTTLIRYIVWAPDYEGAHERRLAVRSLHLENALQMIRKGIVRIGGAVLTLDHASPAPSDGRFFGSCFIIEAESLEAATELIQSDIYYTSGVWNKEKIQILPIMLAHPLPPIPFE